MPHLIQWMKRTTSSGLGKRKCRSDPRDEPDFYQISKRYPIPDYYNENGGKPITVAGHYDSPPQGQGYHPQPPKPSEHDDERIAKAHEYQLAFKREACATEPYAKRYKLSPPDFHPHYDKNYHQSRVSTPQRKWNSNNEYATNHHPRGIDDNDQNSMLFSPTCYYSPGTRIGRDLKDLNVLRDITVDDFWRNVPTARERPVHPASKKENDLYELYDFPIPMVSNEESSASPEGDFVTRHQWQTLYDSLLDSDDPPHLTSNASSQQHHMPPAAAKSNPSTNHHSQQSGLRPRIPPRPATRHMNPNYHCPPRLSRTSYSSSIRANYTSGHMWRGHHAHLMESDSQNSSRQDRVTVQRSNDIYKRAGVDEGQVLVGETNNKGGGGGEKERQETKVNDFGANQQNKKENMWHA